MKTQGSSRLVALSHISWSYIALSVPHGGFRHHSKAVSRGESPYHHAFTVASEQISEFSWAVSADAENSGEKWKSFSTKCFQVSLLVPHDRGKWLVSVEGRALAWSYWPKSETLENHENGAGQWWCSLLYWWPGDSLGSHHTIHLTANGDNSWCWSGCLWMLADGLWWDLWCSIT